jgi:hypothetical protein
MDSVPLLIQPALQPKRQQQQQPLYSSFMLYKVQQRLAQVQPKGAA